MILQCLVPKNLLKYVKVPRTPIENNPNTAPSTAMQNFKNASIV